MKAATLLQALQALAASADPANPTAEVWGRKSRYFRQTKKGGKHRLGKQFKSRIVVPHLSTPAEYRHLHLGVKQEKPRHYYGS